MFFFVAAVTTGVDADGREFAALTPTLKSEGGDPEQVGDFADSKEIGEIFEVNLVCHTSTSLCTSYVLILAIVWVSVNRISFDYVYDMYRSMMMFNSLQMNRLI